MITGRTFSVLYNRQFRTYRVSFPEGNTNVKSVRKPAELRAPVCAGGSLPRFQIDILDYRKVTTSYGNALERLAIAPLVVAAPAVEIQHEEFSLAHAANLLGIRRRERVLI